MCLGIALIFSSKIAIAPIFDEENISRRFLERLEPGKEKLTSSHFEHEWVSLRSGPFHSELRPPLQIYEISLPSRNVLMQLDKVVVLIAPLAPTHPLKISMSYFGTIANTF